MSKINIASKIFLDGADPKESKTAKELLGFLDGQTTNPSLLVKNPDLQKIIKEGRKITEKELYFFYNETIKDISKEIVGPISVEIYADNDTKAGDILSQAREMASWVKNACIKIPVTEEGLKAAETAAKEGISLNMTLCFSQEQAAAVYAATRGAKAPVFVSPFVGRLDDKGENGMDLIKNILKMYESGDSHVKTLAASIRNENHLMQALKISCPAVTVPFSIIAKWAEKGLQVFDESFEYKPELKTIPYKEIVLDKDFREYDVYHPLTAAGIEKFCADWKLLI